MSTRPSPTTKPLTWLITGCSSGLGFAIALSALSHGHNVIATSRNPSRTPELVSQIVPSADNPNRRGAWLQLDVTDPISTINSTIRAADDLFDGAGVDVLVNNAGYALLGAFEDLSEREVTDMFDVNYHGLIKMTQAVLPGMRRRGNPGRTIVNMSSVGGLTVLPSCSAYSATKWAVEALSEGLAIELAPFGIRTLIVEPGAFRTRFLGSDSLRSVPVSEPYKGSVVDKTLKSFASADRAQAGDPVKAADRIVEVVAGAGPGADKTDLLRLPLGPDCVKRVRAQIKKLDENFDAMEELAITTDWRD